ncbi:MAG: hypothetical protein K0S39_5496 [Paenibacillus sp.]|jgi:hypothetical protein|nr:hypothetical protein [Paenibacillus sp.]
MKLKKTKLSLLVACASLMLPAVVSAATTAEPTSSPVKVISPSQLIFNITQTKVNGILVPGNYVTNKDARVAYIPGGVGLVVVDKATALPSGAKYVD